MAATWCTVSRSWSKAEPLRAAAAALWLALAAPAAAQQGLPPPPEDESPENFPEGKGRDETFYLCIACHGTALIKQQGMSRERWDQTLTWMTERHGMPEPDPQERKLIVDYLATNFPPRPRKGRPNPFLQD
jgi:mono/diheme cytochrome c family protein